MDDALLDLKKQLVNGLRILHGEGLFELNYGHISCRIPGRPDRFLILRHIHERGKVLDEVDVEDIIEMDPDGNAYPEGEEAPGERFLHTEIYKVRPDVGAVVHAHPPLCVSLSIAGVEVLPVTHRALIFSPRVPIHDYSGQIDTPEKGAQVAATLGRGRAVLLRAHGVVVVGEDLVSACVAALELEKTAQMQIWAATVGTPRPVPREYAGDGGLFSEGMSAREYFFTAWTYYTHKHRHRLYPVGARVG